ncbi:MAG: monovalent cation/H+ antiporter complex subunit F [Blautia sp.]|nr:monovalent cation/H+ antiporter complex subunit F [Muribaculaceae bacterium]MCM1143971.1 monovalent cation/H+ antiporter complex subunit F [Lachnoclostridium sp.]MCM1211966.1 monovalent cation/H+ antiporter complex subunit F [Blautia sp.]
MGKGIPGLEEAYHLFFVIVLVILAIMIILCLIRAIMGPKVADRIVATNMMGTIIMVIIAILAIMLEEGYLVDICIIYAMISFLAVVVLTKVYMGVYREKKEADKDGSH